jgi:hypothetical protein
MRLFPLFWQSMKAFFLALALFCGAAHGALPDPVRFGVSIEANDLRSARIWLDEGLDPDFMADRIGSGLMIGAWENNLPMMELFYSRGADLNRVNAEGEQALMHAAWQGHIDAVRWLLARGAQVSRPDRQWSALHYAVFAGHDEIAQLLIRAGADVNARSTNGSTVLMMAAREGHADLTQILLARGADPGLRNDTGDTALNWSLRQGHLDIAQSLGTAEQFAVAAKESVRLPPPQRSVIAPKKLNTLLDDIRKARAAGKPLDEVLQAYQAALAEIDKKTKPVPRGMVITAKRAAPGQERVRLVYGPGDAPPASQLVEQIRAARASGRPVDEVLRENEAFFSRYREESGAAP